MRRKKYKVNNCKTYKDQNVQYQILLLVYCYFIVINMKIDKTKTHESWKKKTKIQIKQTYHFETCIWILSLQ